MLNYSIMRLDEDHVEEYCLDICDQLARGIATMPLFLMTLTPEGDPVLDKAAHLSRIYRRYKARLDALGIPSGVLIQASIGHGWTLNEPSSFQKYTNLTDGKTVAVCCPLDTGFRAYIRSAAATIAKEAPLHIMLDDDFRLMARNGCGCACPLHLDRFAALTGKRPSREELYAAICDKSTREATKAAFAQTQIDSLLECAREIRAGIDAVDPTIPGSFCLCGEGAEGAYEIAAIMAGKGNPVVLRLNNASYAASDRRHFTHIMYRAAIQRRALSARPDVLLAETDTCPQNRYSTSAIQMHAHFTFSILEGARGAKHWITRSGYEPKSGKAYRDILAKNAGFYRTLSSLTRTLSPLGCRIPVPARPYFALAPDERYTAHEHGWASPVFDRMGIPFHFDDCEGSVAFFDGECDVKFTNEELLRLLSGKVVLDATAAKHFASRGLGRYLGVDVVEWTANDPVASGEIFFPEGKTGPIPYGLHKLIPTADGVRRVGEVYHLSGGTERIPLFPSATQYQNELGGTVSVFAGVTNFPYTLTDAFGWLCEARKTQLLSLIRELGALPVYYPEDAEVLLRAARTQDGKLFCALLDLSLDPLPALPLRTESPVTKIERLTPDGRWEAVAFTQEADGTLRTDLCAYPFDPVILLLSL